MRVTFSFTGPKITSRIERLRGAASIPDFLKECLAVGLQIAESRERTARATVPVNLDRARPEFRDLDARQVTAALRAQNDDDPVYKEVTRLARLYAPLLKPKASALKPAGMLKLDIRCAVEKAAADLAFRALTRINLVAAGPTVH